MFEIPLFKHEKEAGFTSASLAKASINYFSPIELNEAFDLSKLDTKFLDKFKLAASTEHTPDLFPVKSILVSTNWNGNDDVFHPYEVWAARHTGTDKPFNYEHEIADIIGHTTGSVAIDNDGKEIAEDIALDDLPNEFHILNYDVLYKHWGKDENRQLRANQIIANIADWCVSVEALFNTFDYVLKDEDGNFKIVARNEQTSFLTKMLRAYGGKGVFDTKEKSYQLGRLPRNLLFSGKGLTKKPANSKSIILAKKITESLNLTSKNKNVVYDISLDNANLESATATQKQVENVEAKIMEELQKQINELKADKAKLETQLSEINVKGFKEKISDLEKALEASKAETNAAKELHASAKAELDKAVAKVSEVEKVKAELAEKVEKIEAEKKQTERYSIVVSKLKLADEKAKKLVATLSALSDENFTAHVDMQAEILNASVTAPAVTDEEKKKAEAEKAEAEKKALEQLNSSKKEPALSTKDIDNGVETLRANIVTYLSDYINQTETETK